MENFEIRRFRRAASSGVLDPTDARRLHKTSAVHHVLYLLVGVVLDDGASDAELNWPDGADLALSRGYRRRMRGELEAAASALVAAQRMDPMLLHVYGELMHVAALQEDAAGVRRWLSF